MRQNQATSLLELTLSVSGGLRLADYAARHRHDCFVSTQYARVTRSVGLLIEAEGLHASLGSICWLARRDDQIPCEVVGFTENRSFLMPLAQTDGIEPGSLIRVPDGSLSSNLIPDPGQMLGRVVNGLCEPIDGFWAH